MKIVLATNIKSRLFGLLDKKVCSHGESLMLAPCKSIHSFGMCSNIDIAFIGKDASVLAIERNLPAGKLRSHPQAVAVLERRSCTVEPWLKPGENLKLMPVRYSRK
jgi:uncharacterized membrane protein (UPF0127 family)